MYGAGMRWFDHEPVRHLSGRAVCVAESAQYVLDTHTPTGDDYQYPANLMSIDFRGRLRCCLSERGNLAAIHKIQACQTSAKADIIEKTGFS